MIEVKNLTKKYKNNIAVNNISFDVKKGEIFGLLGENGAGKTTTLEMIEGLRKPTSGQISILGIDIEQNSNKIKEFIGVQLQSSAYYNNLNLEEILILFGTLYKKKIDPGKLLTKVNLLHKRKNDVNNLSGGQKQRFSIAASMVNDPEIVFLDEPTTGLDPLARRNLWKLITEIKSQGKTIILTTHYLEEAEILCDRIAIMESGNILLMGKTHELIEKTKNPFKIVFHNENLNNEAIVEIKKLGKLVPILGKNNYFELFLQTQNNVNKATKIIQETNPESFIVSRATLEDLFIELTGKAIEE